tara:strand:- start:520 stop:1563 length:1044 start_codon:yes stop_codon:yes gene_type:complete
MQIYKYVIKISKFAIMKKITSIFLLIIVSFSSCESDLDINSEWEQVTVVFGLLDQSQEKQYIRINKAFLGTESAYVMAQIADSLNFSPQNLEVKIERVSTLGDVKDTRILVDTVMLKESGTFASDNNIIYTFDTDDFLKTDNNQSYHLTITHKNTGKVITAKTELIHELKLMPYFDNPAFQMGFYSITGDFAGSTVEWDHSKNAEIYQLTMMVNYTEYGTIDTVVKTIQKDFPLIEHDGSVEYLQQITGEGFFNFLANNIKKSSTVNRRINDIDFSLSAGGGGLQTYMNLNIPPTGVVQERPIYSEITNGYGLFSCRTYKLQENVSITSTTKEALSSHLDSLNFIFP